MTESALPFNGPSCRWFAVGSCLVNHGCEERHPPRTGGTKEYTLRLDHLEQEILLCIRLVPRIDSGSRGETHEEAQPHREPDQSEPSDEAVEREASWASCEEGWQVMRVTVEIGERRSLLCRMAHRWDSKNWWQASWPTGTSDVKHLLCGFVAKALTAWRSLAHGRAEDDTPESNEDWKEHLTEQYESGVDDEEDHRPARATRVRAGRRRPRSKTSLGWPTFLR